MKIKLPFLLFMLSFLLTIKSQNNDWALNFGSESFDDGKSIISDNNGNIYSIGRYLDTVDFNPGINESLLYSQNSETYIQKLNYKGDLIWAKNIEHSGYRLNGTEIIIDNNEDIVIIGYLYGYEYISIFVQKLDTSGIVLFTKETFYTISSTNLGLLETNDVAIDNENNILVSGNFINPKTDGITIFNSSGIYTDAFIQKLDFNGNLLWTKIFGGGKTEYAQSLCVDEENNIYLTGAFNDTIELNIASTPVSLISNGEEDIYVMKLNSEGDIKWANSFGSIEADYANKINLKSENEIILTGSFRDTMNIINNLDTQTVISNGFSDIFILQIDSFGSIDWIKQIGGRGSDAGNDIDFDLSSNIYITGRYSDTVDFDTSINSSFFYSKNFMDIFILKLDENANYISNYTINGDYVKWISETALDEFENIYITGLFEDTAEFIENESTLQLVSNGNWDIFIQKIAQNKLLSVNEFEINNLKLYPNPTSNFYTIEIEEEFISAEVKFYDALGKICLKKQLNSSISTLDISTLTNGIYFVQIQIDSGKTLEAKLRISK